MTRLARTTRTLRRGVAVLAALAAAWALTPEDGAAQRHAWWTGASWSAGFGTGDTEQIAGGASLSNIAFEGRYVLDPRLTVGLRTGWSYFAEQENGTVSLGNIDITGLQNRTVTAVPVLLTGHYYLRPSSPGLTPYLGTGLGLYWIENELEIGLTAASTSSWHLGVAPEVGVILPLSGLESYFSARYNHAFEADGVTHSYWTFGVGLAGLLRW